MKQIKKFNITTHARQRSAERGVSLEAMKDVVNYHQSRIQQYLGDHGGFVYRFKKAVDRKTLVVAAEVKGTECWLLTGFYE